MITLPPPERLTIQLWTVQQIENSGENINTVCPWCFTDMIPGYAIDPKYNDSCCRISWNDPPRLKFEDIDIVMVLKCPKCGNSEEIPQDIFKEPPPGFSSWNQYWKSPIQQESK